MRQVMGDAKQYYVYILTSKIGGTLYIGVTNNLIPRVYEHREGLVEGFTKRYGTIFISHRSTPARSRG